MSQTGNTSNKDSNPITEPELTPYGPNLDSSSPEMEILYQFDSPDFRDHILRVPKPIRKKSRPAKPPSKCHLDLLPPELKFSILSQFDSPADVRNLTLASPSYNEVFKLNKIRTLTAIQNNRIHPDTLAMCQELLARGIYGVSDLLNPGRFASFDVVVKGWWATDDPELARAVRNLFVRARTGERIELCAQDLEAFKKVVTVRGIPAKKRPVDVARSAPRVYDWSRHRLLTVYQSVHIRTA